MVAFRSLLSSFVLPIFFLQSIQAAGLFDFESTVSNHTLETRAVPLVGAGACLTLDLSINNLLGQPVPIANGVCICIQGGAITPQSILRIQQSISANPNTVLGTLINNLGGVVNAAATVANALIPQFVAAFPRACDYPANSVADDCGGCGFVCQTGFTLDNGLCCAAGTVASNGVCCAAPLIGSNGVCCASGQIGTNGICCAPGQTGSNGICCTTGLTNTNGVCCAPNQIGSNGICCAIGTTNTNGVCCPLGSTGSNGICCLDGLTNTNGVCCLPDLVGTGGICCPAGQQGCNGVCILDSLLCCATGSFNCNGVCVLSNTLCCALGQQACNGQCIGGSLLCCPTGSFDCNGDCVLNDVVCQSTVVVNLGRRAIEAANCPFGAEACRIPSFSLSGRKSTAAFECINTANDLESCGGCVDPLPGRPQGQDCSAIPDVDSAICKAGRCVIESCSPGFANNGTACIKSSGRKLSGYWAALEEASHIILQ